MVKPPRVFISYTWESEDHKRWVRDLAKRLKAAGIDVRLDQWFVQPGESFTAFMEQEVAAADFVLVVCTPSYARKTNSHQGGVGYEHQIVSGQLMFGTVRSKFIPILRSGSENTGQDFAIPSPLIIGQRIDFRDDAAFDKSLKALIRIIFSKSRIPLSSLIARPSLETVTAKDDKKRKEEKLAEEKRQRQLEEKREADRKAQEQHKLEEQRRKEAQPRRPVEVFYSYSHKDEEFLEKLITHLTLLKRSGVIAGWHDRQISAGTEWRSQINKHLESAVVILLLVSADFLASDYCYDLEMKKAMERHEKGEARVIPVILRHCDWSSAVFAKLQALPKNAKPVKSWADQDEAFTDIAIGIKRAIAEIVP